MKQLVELTLLLLVLLSSCASKTTESAATQHDIGTEYAELLSIIPSEGYTRVEVRTKKGEKPTAIYLLVSRDGDIPSGLPEGEVIRVPVQSLVVNTSAYGYPLKELGSLDIIKGVMDAPYFTMAEIQDGLKQGAIADVGNSQQPTVEKIVELAPDGILINLFEGMNAGALPTAGTPYIKMTDNLESTPLGRAEWIKFLGLLVGKKAEADTIFSNVVAKYTSLANRAKSAGNKPKVLVENMYEGVWYVPGGNSVSARLLEDAGADYPWINEHKNGSLSLSFEEVLSKAGDADIWLLKVFGQQLSKASLLAMDKRYSQFRPFKTSKVWYSDTSTSGLFDYNAFHPEMVLADYVCIFHPELADKSYKLKFFQQMQP